jgi:PTH2 family peptidyl-tRNA hydrolase
MNIKQVIVIRRDLGMRRGKEIAQGSHASIAFLTARLFQLGGPAKLHAQDEKLFACGFFTEVETEWLKGNFRKICCVVNSQEELLGLANKAKEAGLVCEVIEDTGLTEFGGVHEFTALAIGPDTDEKMDPVTGDLKLY